MTHVDKRRIAKNSLMLYVRVILTMIISLWSTRFVLKGLGVEDYGIYNVVGGIVVMFGVLTNSLSASISRFLTYELGRGDIDRLKKTFSTTVYIQFLLGIFILVLCETLGLWFLNNKMNIPSGQMVAANWVFQFSIIAFVIELLSVPYNALIVAHERMKTFAYVGICTSLAKLLIAWIIMYVSCNRLILYGALLLCVSVGTRIFYGIYCKCSFSEVSVSHRIEKNFFRDIFSFAGWNFVGATAGVFRDQGVNIVLNIFFGPLVNASRGIANQVGAAATIFAENFMMALRPQITKTYAAKEHSESLNLVYMGSKMGYFLMLVVVMPIFAETPFLLRLWLNEVPEYSIVFVRLILVNALIDIYSSTLMTLMLAHGNIRNYQLIVGGCNLLILPIAYVFLKMGYAPQSVYIVTIIVSCIALILRLLLLRSMTGLDLMFYIKHVIGITFLTTLFAVLPVLTYKHFVQSTDLYNTLLVGAICLISCMIIIYFVGLTNSERMYVKLNVKRALNRIRK